MTIIQSKPYVIVKDVSDIIQRGFDWSAILGDIGGGTSIHTSIWTCSPGLTCTNNGFTGPYTRVILSGGQHNKNYTLTNTITLSNGELYERSVLVHTVDDYFV